MVFRINKNTDYTVMSNRHLREKGMSLKAKGLMSVMLSLPDDWDYSVQGLAKFCNESLSAVRACLNELEKYGYLVRKRKQDGKGKFVYEYNIYETPVNVETVPTAETTTTADEQQPTPKQPYTDIPHTDKPYTEQPHTEQPYTENCTQLNTNKQNTIKQNTNKQTQRDFQNEFLEIWKIYPRKEGKSKALKAYVAARKSGVTFDTIKNGVERYISHIKNSKIEIRYVKHGSTYFNGQCWDDAYPEICPSDSGTPNTGISGTPSYDIGKFEKMSIFDL